MAKNILIADDAKFIRKMVEDVLRRYGYDVIAEAENGKEAIEKFQANKSDLDLIIMDTKMPEMDGLQAIKAIREINSEIPIIAMASFGPIPIDSLIELSKKRDLRSEELPGGDAIQAVRAGANDFVIKPLKPDRIISSVKKAIGEP